MKGFYEIRPLKKYKWRPTKEQLKEYYTKKPTKAEPIAPEAICRVVPKFVADHFEQFLEVAALKKRYANTDIEKLALLVRLDVLLIWKNRLL